MTIDELLREVSSAYVIDWPSRDVPDSLARAGITTYVHGGPSPDHVDVFEVGEGGGVDIVKRGSPPERADLVYTYRPVDELDRIVEIAREVGARAVWTEYGDTEAANARALVEAAGFAHINSPNLGDEVRRVLGTSG